MVGNDVGKENIGMSEITPLEKPPSPNSH